MQRPVPLTRDLVLVGGGHAHALVLRRWGMSPLPGARLTLINPAPTAPYTGMLPGYVAGHYGRDAVEIDLVRLARFAGARLILGIASGIDRDARLVHVGGWAPLRYDTVSLDVGVSSDLPGIPGFQSHAACAKPMGPFAERWSRYCADVQRGKADPHVAVIGAGVAGVELALAIHHRLSAFGGPRVTLIEAGQALAGLAGNTRAILFERLRRADIRLIEGEGAAEVTADGVVTTAGRCVRAAFTVGAAGAKPFPWLADLGLAHEGGFLTVDATLRSVTDGRVYASGDCAHLGFAPRPKAGVFAVRAAPTLYTNLRAELAGGPRRAFQPQRNYLKLISLGCQEALADRSGMSVAGAWVWRWKDRIDRAFMDKLGKVPPMRRPPLPTPRAKGVSAAAGAQPPCAACGGKVGPGGLAAALAQLPPTTREDVLSRPGDDAAILRTGGATQVITTDHLRTFTEDPVVLARIATLHALGDIWAMGATPQAATATVILPHMVPDMAEHTLSELLGTCADVLRAEGAELTGGHSTFGADMTFGLTLTGLCADPPLTLAGARPGDALLLTRPIGSGTLLAAEMQLKARGRDVAAALSIMGLSQAAPARALVRAGATAMTDVTGFGLAGHLMNLCDASGVGADLSLDAVPLYAGAEALAAAGLRSTLWPENHAALVGRIHGLPDGGMKSPRAALLFDPQTAGGLLAAVPQAHADRTRAALVEGGHHAARIGVVTEHAGAIRVV